MSVRYLMDRYRLAREKAGRPDLTIHHLRHTALTLAGQHGATAAELQARAGHASQAAMAIYQHATMDRDRSLAEKIGTTYDAWRERRPESEGRPSGPTFDGLLGPKAERSGQRIGAAGLGSPTLAVDSLGGDLTGSLRFRCCSRGGAGAAGSGRAVPV